LQDRLLDHFQVPDTVDVDEEDNASEVGSQSTEFQDAVNSTSYRLTLRDLQDSISSFSGSDQQDINHWLIEYEDVAVTVGWYNLQKYIYAKQFLSGAAKLFIRSLTGVRGWNILKSELLKEFGRQLCSADVHKMLRHREKKATETCLEYLYSLMELSKANKLEEESLVSYFIEGVPDSKSIKTGLYRAKMT